MEAFSWTVVPYTTEKKEQITAYLTNNCQGITENTQTQTVAEWAHWRNCLNATEALERCGDEHAYSSTPKYLALNAVVAVLAFVVIFGLTYLLPALGRRYWRWLNT
jgi:hypothetical protein